MYYKNRLFRQGGGIAILARNDLCVMEKTLEEFPEGKLEILSVILHNNQEKIEIVTVYNPMENVTIDEFTQYFEQFERKVILTGDFNAHHSMWDDRYRNNVSGKNLFEAVMNRDNLMMLTPKNLCTYYHVQTNAHSTLDLCLVSGEIFPGSQLTLLGDLGSDHQMIRIEIQIKPSKTVFRSRENWIFASGSWEKWRRELPEPNIDEDPRRNVENFQGSIVECSKRNFKQTKENVNPRYSKPWWNKKCEEFVKQRHRAKNVFKKHPTIGNKIAWRKAEALVKREVKKSKRESFQDFCSTINSHTPAKQVWKKVGLLTNRSPGRKACTLIQNDKIYRLFKTQHKNVISLQMYTRNSLTKIPRTQTIHTCFSPSQQHC